MDKRFCQKKSITLGTTLGATPAIDINIFAWGFLFVPAAAGYVTLTFYASTDPGGTFLPANDSTPAAITKTVVAGNAYPFPTVLFGAGAVKIVADVAGDILLTLKS